MRLKSLEIHGFKSFANKVSFEFGKGITGLVGPNGCGKSNVVDAIKWVLGDMSPKSLRGSELGDVIFKGAGSVAQLGVAEVSLTVTNEDKRLPIDFEEVTVTRRLFRSGESEYLINKSKCRLRDIRDLFYGTGIGREGYSLIEQGKIGQMIQAGPKDLRMIFEEAAGISKFRARKREAESKLERVSQDLLRLNDITREITREIRSIKIQAGRARRYREISDELKAKKLLLGRHQYTEMENQFAQVQADRDQKGALRDSLREKITNEEVRSDQAQVGLQKAEESLSKASASLMNIETRHQSLSDAIQREVQRQEELAHELQQSGGRVANMRRSEEQVTATLVDLRREVDDVTGELNRITAALADGESLLRACTEDVNQMEGEIEQKKADGLEALHKRTDYSNELTRSQTQEKALSGRRETLVQDGERLERERAALDDKVGAFRAEIANLDAEIAGLDSAIKAEGTREGRIRTELEELQSEYEKLRGDRDRLSSRKDVLDELESQLEGYGTGVKKILQSDDADVILALVGSLAELISVDSRYVPAIEALLGGNSDVVVAQDTEAARSLVQWLLDGSRGLARIVPLDVAVTSPVRTTSVCDGVIARALDVVSGLPGAENVIRHCVGDAWIVEDLETAYQIRFNTPSDIRLVTLDGIVVDGSGEIVGGGRSANASVLGRKAELGRISDELASASQAFEDMEYRVRASSKALENSTDVQKRLRNQRYEKNFTGGEKRAKMEEVEKRLRVVEDEIRFNGIEVGDVDESLEKLKTRQKQLISLVEELELLRTSIEEEVKRLAEQVQTYRDRREETAQQLNNLRVERASVGERQESVQQKAHRAERDLESVRSEIQHYQKRIDEFEERRALSVAAQKEKEEAVAALVAEEQEWQAKVDALTAEKAAADEVFQKARQQAASARRELDSVERSVSELAVRENDIANKMQNLVEKLEVEYQVNVSEPLPAPEVSDPEMEPTEETEGAEAVEARDTSNTETQTEMDEQVGTATITGGEPEMDWDLLAKEVEVLTKKLGNLGTVNMSAIDRLDELEDRLEGYNDQEGDINKSRDQLLDLIRKINRESREKLVETIETVRTNFQTIFRKLFGGGKADLIVEPDVDILDAGIEIMARPPHREQISISLLSGGQKALATLALVMGLFQYRPSPVCILDEVDAPLDEHNVGRFAGLIEEYTDTTQFLVITHNKRTMAITDRLYGVTMERAGISKKLSVQLDQVGEDGEILGGEEDSA